MRKEVKSKLRAIQNVLNIEVRNLVEKTLFANVPVIEGQAYAEIGIPNINERMRVIIQEIAHNINVKVDQSNGLLNVEIGILRSDMSDILSLPEAIFATSGVILPWLRWLLLSGSSEIVAGYSFDDSLSTKSRTGGGVMTPGGGWRVPAELAGTIDNNIFTKALKDLDDKLEEVIVKTIKGLL
jgi:hypothetical protein